MKLVLDTNALWHRPLCVELARAYGSGLMEDGRVEVILPAVAYAERVRQLRRDGRDMERWRDEMAGLGVRIEPFGEAEAENLPEASRLQDDWERHARDFLLAAHAGPDRQVVTSDAGVAWRGLRRISPEEAAAALRDILSH